MLRGIVTVLSFTLVTKCSTKFTMYRCEAQCNMWFEPKKSPDDGQCLGNIPVTFQDVPLFSLYLPCFISVSVRLAGEDELLLAALSAIDSLSTSEPCSA